MEYDLKTQIKPLMALNPEALTSQTNGTIIDSIGFESMTFVVAAGAITTAIVTKLQHGDASDLADAVDVPADDLIGALPGFTASEDNETRWVGYIGKKRYVRLVFVSGDATVGATAIMGHPHSKPTE